MHQYLQGCLYAVLLAAAMISGCASPKPITGGPSDESPPVIIETESTPNQQTNFTDDRIVITFDEWINLRDVYSQLIISPPMPEEPEISQKGKSIIIELPDSLRQATTYTINFGDAITDLNEGNILKNYAFVFSTGPELDSLQLRGSVVDAVTLKSVPDIWVMMYRTGEDSAVYKRKPDYLARTDTAGRWTISFLPPDSFDIVALKDENLNFLYDQPAEYFGWHPETIYTGDGQNIVPPIMVFPLEKRRVVTDVIHTVPGWMKFIVESPYPKPVPALDPPLPDAMTFWDADTLHVWYDPAINYAGYALLDNDSTRIRASTQPSMIERPILVRAVSGRLKQGEPALFSLNVPIATLDTSRIIVVHDSLGTIPVVVRRVERDPRQFSISGPFIGQQRYPVMILPGAITDFWGRMNDTIRQSVVVSSADQFGDLFITLDGLDSTKQYVVVLKEGPRQLDTFVITEKSSVLMERRGLLPQTYTIEVVEDANRNGFWDTGSYREGRQPEKKMIFTPEKLRAGWEQQVRLQWK